MTAEQILFYTVATLTGIMAAAAWTAAMSVKESTVRRIKNGVTGFFALCGALVVCAVVVVPVYILTRLNDGIAAFLDAALPELTGLVCRTRYLARCQAEKRAAAWDKSLRYDREDHVAKMAEFDDSIAAAEEAYDAVGLGGIASERY